MSENWDSDDLARMVALENAFSVISLMWLCQFADQSGKKPSEVVKPFSDAVAGAVYDTKQYPHDFRNSVKSHLERMLGNVAEMAKLADQGYT